MNRIVTRVGEPLCSVDERLPDSGEIVPQLDNHTVGVAIKEFCIRLEVRQKFVALHLKHSIVGGFLRTGFTALSGFIHRRARWSEVGPFPDRCHNGVLGVSVVHKAVLDHSQNIR